MLFLSELPPTMGPVNNLLPGLVVRSSSRSSVTLLVLGGLAVESCALTPVCLAFDNLPTTYFWRSALPESLDWLG